MTSFADKILKVGLTAAHGLLRRARSAHQRPGIHALALTPAGRIILVKLRYAPGWRFPGGGRARDEDPRDAVLRELREEIGMTCHGPVTLAAERQEATDFKHDLASLFIVRDVLYRPRRWSWEVERIIEVPFDELPTDL